MKLSAFGCLTGLVVLLSAPALAEDEIKIGLIQPLTGSVAYNGNCRRRTAPSLRSTSVNAAGGVLGKKIELVIEDGQCQPANSVNAAEKLIQSDKVAAPRRRLLQFGHRRDHAGRRAIQDPADHRRVLQGRPDRARATSTSSAPPRPTR